MVSGGQSLDGEGYLVDGDSVDIGVIHKPNDLVGEEFPVVLRGQVGLSGLGGVQLQTFADSLPEHIQGRVGLHDLGHGLLDQGFAPREPVTVRTAQRETYRLSVNTPFLKSSER